MQLVILKKKKIWTLLFLLVNMKIFTSAPISATKQKLPVYEIKMDHSVLTYLRGMQLLVYVCFHEKYLKNIYVS